MKRISDQRLFELLKAVDENAVRVPPGWRAFAIAIQDELEQQNSPLLVAADALDCFWNASIGAVRVDMGSSFTAETVSAIAVGFAAVAEHLREQHKNGVSIG